MEEKIKEVEKTEEKCSSTKAKKKKVTILGIPLDRLCVYFILYSVLGFFLETVFGLVTKGVLESRKSFLYGPFCAIYGLGAVLMIPILNKVKSNKAGLFLGGFLVGTITEYLVSLLGEMVFHVKWWDYSNLPFNIYGRVCLVFSLVWGILGILLMQYINPKIDILVDKIPKRYFKSVAIVGITVLFIDWLISSLAMQIFFARLVTQKEITLKDESQYQILNSELYYSEIIQYLSEKEFTDEKILKAFPNLKCETKEGKVIFVRDLFPEIDPYYARIFVKRLPDHNRN